jgi:putative membrane protein
VKKLKKYIVLALKGAGMGAANVIPGVSGGTVALITGIFEELINSIKSFDLEALKLLFTGKFKQFAEYVNLKFLLSIFLGVFISIVSLAKLLEFLFANYPIYIWAYFFGLILASIYFVGRTVHKWSAMVIITFIIGALFALYISFMSPANENDNFLYLMLCGVVAICSMILPGLSGSFVLILMGNYKLIVIDAITNMRFEILLPVLIGAGVGLVAFSHLLAWIYKRFRDETISTLTGFILGSLIILWPWKNSFDISGSIIPVNGVGAFIDANGTVISDIKVFGYKQILPENFDTTIIIALTFILTGIISIWLMEKFAGSKQTTN